VKPAVWITGGGSGIGRALALAFYRHGHFVVISGRRAEALDETRAMSGENAPQKLIAIPGDVTDPAHATKVVKALADRGRVVDILVNNAGQNSLEPMDKTALSDFAEAIRINCLGPIQCARAVLPGMHERHRGAIVNIISVLGKFASSGSASYSVSKYALAGFTDVLRQELVRTKIHVLGVYPGYIQTPMTQSSVRKGSFKSLFGKSPDQIAAAILRAIQFRQSELFYPWYVPMLLRFHRWMPRTADRLARRLRGEK
jgi:short-subunit dehydrogenase